MQIINDSIKNIINDFENYPDKYLTESDVRCALVNELMRHPEFHELQTTEDGSESIPIHTEVRWYGQSGKLKWRSDIVIINMSTLRVKNDMFKLPSKGFGFNKPRAIIEIKLRRINGDPDKVFIAKIKQDIKKLRCIKREIQGDYFCSLVVLDKKGDITSYLPEKNRNLTFFYKSIKSSKVVEKTGQRPFS